MSSFGSDRPIVCQHCGGECSVVWSDSGEYSVRFCPFCGDDKIVFDDEEATDG